MPNNFQDALDLLIMGMLHRAEKTEREIIQEVIDDLQIAICDWKETLVTL